MLGLGLGLHRAINFVSSIWTPAQITTSLWLDASNASTITENITVPGNISQWDDLSGNGNHATQSVEAEQPITGVNSLGGLNVIKFDSDYMSLLANTVNGVESAIFVTNNLAGNSVSTSISIILNASVTSDFTFIRSDGIDADYDISIDGASGNSGNASVNGGVLVSGGNIDLGQTLAENNASNIWYADYTDTFDVNYIGLFGNDMLKGDIAEVILLDYIPTPEIRRKLEVYLQSKWNTPALP